MDGADRSGMLPAVMNTEVSVAKSELEGQIGPVGLGADASLARSRRLTSDSNRVSRVKPYHSCLRLRLRGPLDVGALGKALGQIVNRYDPLRLAYCSTMPNELIANSRGDVLEVFDEEIDGESTVDEMCRREVSLPFDVSSESLVRARLLKVSANERVLAIIQHEVISGEDCAGVLIKELVSLYCAYVTGRPDPLPRICSDNVGDLNSPASQTRRIALRDQFAFWARHLLDAPELIQLPTNRPRIAGVSYVVDRMNLTLSRKLTAQLRELAWSQGVSLSVALLVGWSILLARLSGQTDMIIGIKLENWPVLHNLFQVCSHSDTFPLRVRLMDDQPVGQLLMQINTIIAEMHAHLESSVDDVLKAIQSFQVDRQESLAEFRIQRTLDVAANSEEIEIAGLTLGEMSSVRANGGCALVLCLTEKEDTVIGAFRYGSDVFDPARIEQICTSLKVLLEGMSSSPDQSIWRLPILTQDERQRIVYDFNQPSATPSRGLVIHELFENQVISTPDSTAIVFEGNTLSYAKLNGRANQLARYLRTRAVGPGQRVAVCVDRSIAMVVGILGVLKAGGAYVPLDPEYPPERLAYMLQSAAPRIVLTKHHLRSVLPIGSLEVVEIDCEWSEISRYGETNLSRAELGLCDRDLAYVIFTSGSTGAPKGAMNEHRGMVNRICVQSAIEAISSGDICCQKTSVSFVDAVFEIFGPLCNGRPLVIVPAATVRDIREMGSLIARERITQLITVPSLARSMLQDAPTLRNLSSVRTWTLSGEEVQRDLLIKLQRDLPLCEFVTLYGASEVSSDAAHFKTRHFEDARVPLGRPVANVQVYVLDSHGEPVPIGVTGEIYVGGVGVGRGYLNSPDLTALRFRPDPFNGDPTTRLYRTGDLGRWRSDGMLEFLGRNDYQVKIRGFRVEVGEIESLLLRDPDVLEAAVIPRGDSSAELHLVAYLSLRDSRHERRLVTLATLRSNLKAALPAFMVPSAFVLLQEMPRTPNGKLNRRALPAPEREAYSTKHYEAPRGPVEGLLVEIWQTLLEVDQISRHDNFFELGGHSLLVVQVVDAVLQAGLTIDVRSIYACPTLADLACKITVRGRAGHSDIPPHLIPDGSGVITPQMLTLISLDSEQINGIVQTVPGGAGNIQDVYPLAPLQEGILFHHLRFDGSQDTYVRPLLFELSSRKTLDQFTKALQEVINRHDILRSAVLWDSLPQPVQVVYRKAALAVIELQLDRNREPVDQLKDLMKPEYQRLNLQRAPLMRVQAAGDPSGARWYVLLQVHHLIFDDESLETMLAEVSTCFQGRGSDLPIPGSYRDHVSQALAGARSRDGQSFFRDKLNTIDGPTAPFGLLDVHGSGGQTDEYRRTLEGELARRVRMQARRLRVTAATLFHSAWGLVVSRTSGRDDLVFGTVLHGRLQSRASDRRTLGLFINTLPLRMALRDVTTRRLVELTHEGLLGLIEHEQTPLALAQRAGGVDPSTPLFTTLFNYLHKKEDGEAERSWCACGMRLIAAREWTNYPLVLQVEETGGDFVLVSQTDCRVEARRIAGYMHQAVQSLVDALEHDPSMPAVALPILPEKERREIIESFNTTYVPYPREKLIHQTLEDQTERTPHAVAVVCNGQQLTYCQLNSRANQVARVLRSLGLRPDERAAVYLDRSLDLVIGLLGILKAGGAYVPLDPNHPAERVDYMLADSAPAVVLTLERLRNALPKAPAAIFALDTESSRIDRESSDNLDSVWWGLESRHLAYVIYTSGSTGKPKGVAVEHHSVINLMQWHCSTFGVRQGSLGSCVAAIGFDAAVWEMWPPLSVGATIALASTEIAADPDSLVSWWDSQPLDVGFLTTPIAEILIRRGIGNSRLRALLVGGDRLRERPVPSTYALVNNYGPTEATVVATSGRLNEADPVLHVGRPIANTSVYILDGRLEPAPLGVSGELYIGGAGVSRGYLGKPDLTAERFLCDPFAAETGARMYKTGDLARWRAEGTIEYLGRCDHQVKIRGFRIELGEIEVQLMRHERIKDAVLTAPEDASGDRRLIAYVVLADISSDEAPLSEQQLRNHLKAALPDYMVPSAFVILERIPFTSNGKVDLRALPRQELGSRMGREYKDPRGSVESAVATIWQNVLQVERVGRDDNFFELGGHSLVAMQMLVRLRATLSIDMAMGTIFKYPTVRELAEQIENLNRSRLLERVRAGGDDIELVLEQVASMSESRAETLLRELERGTGS
jgi:amino acid adenylation domain-containing protein